MAEALRRAIKSRHANKNLEGIKITTNFVATHRQFVDDNLLLGTTRSKEAAQFQELLESYGKASVWEVWKEQNRKLFDGKARSVDSTLSSLEATIVENIHRRLALSTNLDKNFTSWDNKMRFSWNGIKIPPFLGNKSGDRENAVWAPPQYGWFKFNFDGASKGNPGASGIGCVVKDHSGIVVGKMSNPTPPNTNNVEEFKTLLYGLSECFNHGIRNLAIEGDSSIVINAAKMTHSINWKLQALLERILALLPSFNNYNYNHIFRERKTKVCR
ncbi:uncharacterized protein LOC131030239 [Cryptomeria japonica]|uniref:uncharacterized protein LOC131030239 n=1 Tax=Cryptomeria japonica TaxID=3369 RepID=UPI0025AC5810|nr:uncharacterized protein LOC131030239 [Cryptomeria japonica]